MTRDVSSVYLNSGHELRRLEDFNFSVPGLAASRSCRDGPRQSKPETTTFVSATVRIRGAPLRPRGLDFRFNFRFSQWRVILGGQTIGGCEQVVHAAAFQFRPQHSLDRRRFQQALAPGFLSQRLGQVQFEFQHHAKKLACDAFLGKGQFYDPSTATGSEAKSSAQLSQTTPCSSIASATLRKPAMFAPAT